MKNKSSVNLCLNGIAKPQFVYWIKRILQLSRHPDTRVYYFRTKSTPEDEKFIAEFLGEIEVCELKDFSSTPDGIKNILFTDTADNLEFIEEVRIDGKKACFFGGLGILNYQKQAECAERLNIDRLITDILPDELANLSGLCPKYFLSRFIFLPPDLPSTGTRTGESNEEILVLSNQEAGQSFDHVSTIICNAFSAVDTIRFVNLDNVLIGNFRHDMVIPSQNCHTVVYIGTQPLPYHMLSLICRERGLRLIMFDSNTTFSPVRSILCDDSDLIEWIDSIKPLQTVSLRQKITRIKQKITPNNSPTNSDRDQDANIVSKYSENILQNLFCDKNVEFYQQIFRAYTNYFSVSEKTKKSYITHPIDFLENSLDIPKTLSFSLYLLFFEGAPEVMPDKVLRKLMQAAMRFAYKLPYNLGSVHFISKILLANQDLFFSCLGGFNNSNNTSKDLNSFHGAIQMTILTSSMEEELREKCIISLLDNKCSIELSSRYILSLGDFDSFRQVLSDAASEKLYALAGTAVYFALLNQPIDDDKKLDAYEKICSEAIEANQCGIVTHRALSIVKILKGKGQGVSKELRNPSKPSLEFSQMPFCWHELALFSIFAGDDKEAQALLDSPKNKNGGPDPSNRLGSIAINLLLGNIEKAGRFAAEARVAGTLSTWSTESVIAIPYYIAYYHRIIFKYCSDKKAEKVAEKIMDLTKIELDKAFLPLIDRISSANKPEENILKLSKDLSRDLPQIG
jgi:hypothetical protein